MRSNAAEQLAETTLPAWIAALRALGQWALRVARPCTHRRLRLRETLSLGDRRFVAVIEFNDQEFLVGGGGSSFELLARLEGGKVITDFRRPWERQRAGEP